MCRRFRPNPQPPQAAFTYYHDRVSARAILDMACWDAEVTKMIKVMGAPVDEAGARAIKDYLTKNYVQLNRRNSAN
jgi:hypothetical protein